MIKGNKLLFIATSFFSVWNQAIARIIADRVVKLAIRMLAPKKGTKSGANLTQFWADTVSGNIDGHRQLDARDHEADKNKEKQPINITKKLN